MIFLTDADINRTIKGDSLDQIIKQDTSILNSAELAAIELATGYLNEKYDVETIFAALDTERNPLLVEKLVDIVCYKIHDRIAPKMVPQLRRSNYEDAIEYFKSVQSGKITPTLPRKPVTDPETYTDTRIIISSNPRFNYGY